jgi:hypothetical protein
MIINLRYDPEILEMSECMMVKIHYFLLISIDIRNERKNFTVA